MELPNQKIEGKTILLLDWRQQKPIWTSQSSLKNENQGYLSRRKKKLLNNDENKSKSTKVGNRELNKVFIKYFLLIIVENWKGIIFEN